MQKAETLAQFYERHGKVFGESQPSNKGQFNVYSRDHCSRIAQYNRRDFYKISLVIGTGKLWYADRRIEITQPALLFSNPIIPYSWQAESEKQSGYFCLFTQEFFHGEQRSGSLQDSPLFKVGGSPVYLLDDAQVELISDLFQRMLKEIGSEYIHKYDVLRSYTNLIIHEAMKSRPADSFVLHNNAASRINNLFNELLERQFPVDAPDHILTLKTAADYARSLSIHVNHLNRSVKEVTGKTTTEHISERIIKEAKALLLHTDLNIAEIAYALGFEYPSYFNNFFRKQTQQTPSSFRD